MVEIDSGVYLDEVVRRRYQCIYVLAFDCMCMYMIPVNQLWATQ